MDKAGDSEEAKSWNTTTGEVLWTKRGRTQVDTKNYTSGKRRIWYIFLPSKPMYAMLNSIWICHWLHTGRLRAIFISIFIRNAPKVYRGRKGHIWGFLTSFSAPQPAEKNCSVPEQQCISPQLKHKSPLQESRAFPWIVNSLPSVLFIAVWEVFPLPFPFPKAMRQ